ncbi:MAG: hypothetical protein WD906_09235 [Anaerolineales bacterium]
MKSENRRHERIEQEVGATPRLRILNVGGSLRLIGGEGTRLEAHADDPGGLSLQREGETWELQASSDCSIFLPSAARIEIGSIGGEARLRGLSQELLLRNVGGDLELRRVAKVALEHVGGDLSAARVGGDLMADRIGGDATLTRVAGRLHLRAVGGDARIRGAQGAVAKAAGDVNAELCPGVGWSGSLEAGGDLRLRLCQEASAHVRYRAGGEVRLPVSGPTSEKGEFVLGAAEGDLELSAGANLIVSLVAQEELETAADIEDKVFGHVAEALHRVEFLSARSGRLAFDGEAMGKKIHRAIEGAMSRAGASARRGHPARDWEEDRGPSGAGSKERLAILHMLEAGRINVGEAEQLLRALEGEA